MKFATKEDLIEKYALKRKALEYDDVKDLLECFIGYFNQTVGDVESKDISYRINNFGTLFESNFDTSNLVDVPSSAKRKKAEKRLQEYILTGLIRPKKIKIQHDRFLRI